jgi:hypothetical protein
LLAFHYHEKIPEVVHFNEPLRFSLVHTFGNFTPWSIGSIAFGPVVRQNFMAGTHGGANCLPHGGKEAKRRKDQGPNNSCKCSRPARASAICQTISKSRPYLLKVPLPPSSTMAALILGSLEDTYPNLSNYHNYTIICKN